MSSPLRIDRARPARPAIRRAALALSLLAAGLLAAGCTWLGPAPQLRGNRVDADQMKQLVPGTTTQTDAQALLGSPTAKGTFDPNTWIYVSELTQPVIGGTQSVLRQNVLQLNFDNRGVLRDVKALNQKNSLPVSVVARTTPSPGTNASFLQQLFGNVGRFNPLGTTQTPTIGGGAPSAY